MIMVITWMDDCYVQGFAPFPRFRIFPGSNCDSTKVHHMRLLLAFIEVFMSMHIKQITYTH